MIHQTFENLRVGHVDRETAKRICLERHYSHKWNTPFGVRNFGIYDADDNVLGVAVYGYPMNPKSWAAITTADPAKCLELNRLWIDDCLVKNTETWMMGRTFSLLRADGYELIQSFADGRLGVGTIYQAANFTYHGYHESVFHRDRSTGEVMHDSPFNNTASITTMLSRNMGLVEDRIYSFRVRTYRYLYPLNRHARKTILLPAEPYPKERTGEVEAEYAPVSQIARCAVLAKALDDPRYPLFYDYLVGITDDPDGAMATQWENPNVIEVIAQMDDRGPTLFSLLG